jgi:hypothetical protein
MEKKYSFCFGSLKALMLALTILLATNIYSQKLDKYDLLINKIKIREQSDVMIAQMVDAYAKQKPNVPLKVWQEIKKTPFSNSFLADVKKLFKENYTIKEVDILISTIDKYGANVYEPKPEITQKMYDLGKVFGKSVGNQIVVKLKSLGY